MKKRLTKGFAVVVAAALSAGLFVSPAKAANEIIIWADETRGPNLEKVFKAKSDWVAGYTIKVVPFSSFDALKDAWDKSTGTAGPDIILGANSWVAPAAKSGKMAPITLTAAQRAGFNSSQFFDVSYRGKIYGIPVDVNNVAMVFNTKLVTTAPKTFGEMVEFYKANKTSKGLVAGLCVAGGGMSWGAHSVFSALGANAFLMKKSGEVNTVQGFNPTTFGKNVQKYLLDGTKSNGFFPASDTGCKDNYLAGKVPYAIIGNWEWKSYADKGFAMNLMPVPGVEAGTYGKMFGSVSGAFLTSYAAKHGVEAGAKSLLVNFFGSTAGQIAYQKLENRPPAEKGAAASESIPAGPRGFGAAAALAGIPEIGVLLNNSKGGANYWDSAPAYWTAVLVNGKDAVTEARKLAAIWRANVTAGKVDL